ncbi:hypothetical protein HPT25_05900 [Bacillus sp. BRMEA1]|uniref:hypothetical protein n=1 Tax=Neobacillus endophyticus TaxID=2738405 RepID=UPI0015669478|nr:hypothetical protein [Neobacillus endophyticus]NRD77028.1 hypothetical protein [Neobacillus endophyticus]
MSQFKASLATLGLKINNLLGINHKTFDLTSEQFDIFKKVYIKHLQSMRPEERRKRAIEYIDSIIWDSKEACLKVYYDGGECWHYTKAGEWY